MGLRKHVFLLTVLVNVIFSTTRTNANTAHDAGTPTATQEHNVHVILGGRRAQETNREGRCCTTRRRHKSEGPVQQTQRKMTTQTHRLVRSVQTRVFIPIDLGIHDKSPVRRRLARETLVLNGARLEFETRETTATRSAAGV